MKRIDFVLLFVATSLSIVVLWFLGLYFSLYWIFWWYDLIMHLIGGFWVGLIVYTLFVFGNNENVSSLKNLLLSIIMSALLVGLMWEWLEIKRGLASALDQGYFFDTTTDLVADIFGSLLSFFTVSYWLK